MCRFKLINTGSTRLVFLISNYAIKIPRCFVKPDNSFYGKLYGFLMGWLSNRHEYMWSKTGMSFLLPVKLSIFGSLIIVMDRAEEITEEEFFSLSEEDFNFEAIEFKIDSFGKINNTIFALDYGK